jgi:hypothetical protein
MLCASHRADIAIGVQISLTGDTDHFSATMRPRRIVVDRAGIKPPRPCPYIFRTAASSRSSIIRAQCGRDRIFAASTGSAIAFLSRGSGNRRIRRDRRHGLVGLSPCFSRALVPISAESRHEDK